MKCNPTRHGSLPTSLQQTRSHIHGSYRTCHPRAVRAGARPTGLGALPRISPLGTSPVVDANAAPTAAARVAEAGASSRSTLGTRSRCCSTPPAPSASTPRSSPPSEILTPALLALRAATCAQDVPLAPEMEWSPPCTPSRSSTAFSYCPTRCINASLSANVGAAGLTTPNRWRFGGRDNPAAAATAYPLPSLNRCPCNWTAPGWLLGHMRYAPAVAV